MLPTSNAGNPQEPTGGAGQPSQPPSTPENQPLPDYVNDLRSQNEQLRTTVTELQTQFKGLEKGTNKRFGEVSGNIKRILELKENGLTESQIERELRMDQLLQDRESPGGQSPGREQPATIIDVEPVLKSLQFSDNDPGLAALRIKHSGKPQELLAAASDLRLKQLTGAGPTPGTGLPMGGGQQSLSDNAQKEQDIQDYQKEMQAASGKGYQFGDAIKEKYRQKGVPVDSITFKYG